MVGEREKEKEREVGRERKREHSDCRQQSFSQFTESCSDFPLARE
jgi:hypothetical protein